MFIKDYVDRITYQQVCEIYDSRYLDLIDEDNFISIYSLFKEYKFYFIEDIVVRYLEIFSMNYDIVKQRIENLRVKLGKDFVYYIGHDLTYLEEIVKPD